MAAKNLKIDQLELDVSNPRFNKAGGQHEAMQRIIEDQDAKLANLADSIVEDGLNPMDRLLVLKSERKGKYVVLEGNRRTLALKVLRAPTLLSGLDVRSGLRKRLEKAAESFDVDDVEPVPCFEVQSRAEANAWIDQRHSGENEGRGIVNWSGEAASRFRGSDPALQALDFVRQHAELDEEQKKLLDSGRFPITTLDRLLSTPDVRKKIGVEIKDNKLLSTLPPDELMKPLRRIVLDLAEKKINVTKLKSKEQQIDYVTHNVDAPDMRKKLSASRALEAITEKDFPESEPAPSRKRGQRATKRTTIVPKHCRLNITNSKTEEIYAELRKLKLASFPNSIAVMLRVFLENSVDHYLTKIAKPAISLTFTVPNQGEKDKSLATKIGESIDHMIQNGAPKKDFEQIKRATNDKRSPLSVDLLHSYIHSRFVAAAERELTVAWDMAQPFFELIWP